MPSYEPTLFVEPLGYQPVEFLDIPPMNESSGSWTAPSHASTEDAPIGRESEPSIR